MSYLSKYNDMKKIGDFNRRYPQAREANRNTLASAMVQTRETLQNRG